MFSTCLRPVSTATAFLLVSFMAGPVFAEPAKTLEQFLRTMERDAKAALKSSKAFPTEPARLPPKLAADPQTRLKITKCLTKRLDSNPSVDGYLKWQLLNLGPDFQKAGPSDLGRIASAMPSLVPMPQLNGSQRKLLAASSKMDTATFQKRVMPYLDRYHKEVEQVRVLNKPAWEYRDKVVSRMPVEGGLRLYANVLNAHEQYRALHFEMVKTGKRKNSKMAPANPVSQAVFPSARMLEAAPKPPPGSLRRAILARVHQINKMYQAHTKAGHVIGYKVEGSKVTARKPPNPFQGKKTSLQKLETFLKTGRFDPSKK